MDEFGLVWLSSVWFDEVDFLKCSSSASQLSFTNLFIFVCESPSKTNQTNSDETKPTKSVPVPVPHRWFFITTSDVILKKPASGGD